MDRGVVRTTAGTVCICAMALLSVHPTASAGDIYIGPSAYFASPDSGLHAKSDLGAQLTLGYRFTPHLGFELLSESDRFELNDGTGTLKQRGASAQGLYHFLIPDAPISPFISLGGGWMRTSFRHMTSDAPLVRGGVGLNWDLPDMPVSLKADASFRHVFSNDAVPFYASQNQTDQIYTVGLQYSFGKDANRVSGHQESAAPSPVYNNAVESAPAAQQAYTHPNNCTVNNGVSCSGPPDQDGDGIPDVEDKCPDTPPNAVVDADGCLLYLRKDAAH